MGSCAPSGFALVEPQQPEDGAPSMTRRACLAYRCWTTSFTPEFSLFRCSFLFRNSDDLCRFNRFVARTALRVEEREQLLQDFGVGAVGVEDDFAGDGDQVFVY